MTTISGRERAILETTVRFHARRTAVPAVWHLSTIIVSVAGGAWIIQAYDNSLIGFFGVALLMWGVLVKIPILLIIYGLALYGALLRPNWFAHVAERRRLAKIEQRVQADFARGDVRRAEDRFHGLMVLYPDNMSIKRRLAQFLVARGALADAGRVLAFHPAPMAQERDAIQAFMKSCGHDPFTVLRRTVKGISGLHLNAVSFRKIEDLHAAIERNDEKQSWLYRSVSMYLAYRAKSSGLRGFWHENKALALELIVLTSLVSGLWALHQTGIAIADTVVINVVLITLTLIYAYWAWTKDANTEKLSTAKGEESDGIGCPMSALQTRYARQYIGLPASPDFPQFARDGFELVNLAWEAISRPPSRPLPTLTEKRDVLKGSILQLKANLDETEPPIDIWIEAASAPKFDIHKGRIYAVGDAKLGHLVQRQIIFHANHIASVSGAYDGPRH